MITLALLLSFDFVILQYHYCSMPCSRVKGLRSTTTFTQIPNQPGVEDIHSPGGALQEQSLACRPIPGAYALVHTDVPALCR